MRIAMNIHTALDPGCSDRNPPVEYTAVQCDSQDNYSGNCPSGRLGSDTYITMINKEREGERERERERGREGET